MAISSSFISTTLQDEENGAQDVESEEDSGIQSKEELPRSPEKRRITPTPSPAKTKSNGGERLLAAAAAEAAEEEEAERRTVRSSGDGGGRKKVGQSGQLLLLFVCFTFVCICASPPMFFCNFNVCLVLGPS